MARRRGPTDIELDIQLLDSDGLGVGIHEEREYRVRNALPGERVKARILKRRKGLRFGDAIETLEHASPNRTASVCTAFPRCGGCVFHHLDYARQLEEKQTWLTNELQANDVVPHAWRRPTSQGRTGYRKKARLGVKWVGESVLVGFRESFSNRVARLTDCPILSPDVAVLIEPLKALLTGLDAAREIPQIEVAQGDSDVALIFRHLQPLSAKDESALSDFANQYGARVLLQSGGPDTVRGIDDAVVPELSYAIPEFGVDMSFDPRHFTQVNAVMNRELISTATAYLGQILGGEPRILDLFCGIGNFAIPLARRGGRVSGFEMGEGSVSQARKNALKNGVDALTDFTVRDLYASDAPLPEADAWVLDPPRSGAGPMLASWLAGGHSVQDIVYVSCGPVSFAADAHTIVNSGFSLIEVGVYDMFPFTGHVETIGYFSRTRS